MKISQLDIIILTFCQLTISSICSLLNKQVDKTTSCKNLWNVKLTTLEVNETLSWWNNKLKKCKLGMW
jgi:hypothetical protein